MKIQKKKYILGGGGVGVWSGGGGEGGEGGSVGGVGLGVQGGCERRIEVFVKIQKKKKIIGGGGGGGWGSGREVGGGGGGGVREGVRCGRVWLVGGSGWM